MKILLLAPQPFYQERGTPIAVRLLAHTLAELGHTIHLLVFAEGEDIDIPGVTLHRIALLPGLTGIKPGLSLKKLVSDLFFFLKCIRLVRLYDFDLIHAVEEAVFMAGAVRKLFKLPYVYDMDSCMSRQIVDRFPAVRTGSRVMERIESRAMQGSSGVVAVCRSLEDLVRQFAPQTPVLRLEDISLLDTGKEGREDLRRELGITGIMLMYVGNLEQYQGIDLLLDGFREAAVRNRSLHLLLIGGESEDIELLRQRVSEQGMAEKVTFCGKRSVELLGYYLAQADILVSPRTQGENTPMKIYSYLDSGVPVLATDLPTHTQVLDGAIACLVEPTPGAVADGILRLAENSATRKEIGRRARQRVRQEYSLAAYRRKLKLFYEQVESSLESTDNR